MTVNINEFANKLCDALHVEIGGDWKIVWTPGEHSWDRDDWTRIGAGELVLSLDRRNGRSDPGRVVVGAVYEESLRKEFRYQEYAEEITVGAARPAEALAKDIARRLIGSMKETLAVLKERRALAERQQNERTSNVERMLRAAGPAAEERDSGCYIKYGKGWGTATVHQSNVDIDLRNLPFDLAAEVLEFLRKKNG